MVIHEFKYQVFILNQMGNAQVSVMFCVLGKQQREKCSSTKPNPMYQREPKYKEGEFLLVNWRGKDDSMEGC